MDPVTGVILGAAITGICGIVIEIIRRPQRAKIDETHRQLTTNHHVSSPPTALDKLDSIERRLEGQDLILLDVKETLNRHIEWHMGKK